MVEKIVYKILQSREDRALMQEELINKYKVSLISFTLNIPGSIKDSEKYRSIHGIGMEEIINNIKEKNHKIEYIKTYHKITGPEGFIVVDMDPMDPMELKKLTIGIEEEHELGRVFDIDVFDLNHNQISRNDFGGSLRKCLICNENAKVCSREATHKVEELLERIDKLYKNYIS